MQNGLKQKNVLAAAKNFSPAVGAKIATEGQDCD